MKENIKRKLEILPLEPGCYLMKDKFDNIIYVGKAKILKNRVSQYFNRAVNGKTALLVHDIEDFDYIVTSSEKESLLLELNLIRKHMPKYNILLKDGSHYPYILLTKEEHPKLRIVRKVDKKKGKHFGPYSDSSAARKIVNMLNQLYPLRKCQTLPNKPCLYYHTKQCLAPCINKVYEEEKKVVKEVTDFLNGDNKQIKKILVEKMKDASEKMQYEQALEYKNMIDYLDHINEKQNVESATLKDCDVFGFHTQEGYIAFSTLMYRNNHLIAKEDEVLPYFDSIEDALYSYLNQFYVNHIVPKNIIVPNILDKELLEEVFQTNILIPTRGRYQEIISMVANNAIKAMEQKVLGSKKYQDNYLLMNRLKEMLGLEKLERIEMIDNSHTAGTNLVAGVIVFINGVPSKKDYRKYRLSNLNSVDDLESTKEVVYKRLYKTLTKESPLMDLFIVDGGITQLHVAKEVANSMNLQVPIIGLAKNDKHQTRAIIDLNEKEIVLDKNDDLFMFLMKLQDEVHRYAITYHKKTRSKSLISSALDEIKGLGKIRKEKLLSIYKTISNIVSASIEELSQYVPIEVAKEIKEKLSK